jgi:hypothetical protein
MRILPRLKGSDELKGNKLNRRRALELESEMQEAKSKKKEENGKGNMRL